MNLYKGPSLLLYYFFLVSCATLVASLSLPAADINGKLLQTVKSFMDTKVDPCENIFQYACGNWENAHEDHSRLLDSINYLDFSFNQKILQILNDTTKSPKHKTDSIYARVYDYYETCEQIEYVNVSKYLDILKPMDNEEWPARGESWNPKSEWNMWSTLGNLAAVGFNGLFFALETNQHNALSYHIVVDQVEPITAEYNQVYFLKWSDDKNVAALAERMVEFLDKLKKLQEDKPSKEAKIELISLKVLQQQVKDIDFFAYFSGFLGEKDLDEIQIKVKNLNYLRQLAELVKNAPRDVLIHSLKISLHSYLETQVPSKYEWSEGCIPQMRKLFPLALNYVYENQVYQSERPTTDPIIEKVFYKMQQKLVEIFQGLNVHYSSSEIEFLTQKILKMKLNIGNIPQGVDDQFYMDYLGQWKVIKADYYRTHLSAMKHRATRDYGLAKLKSPSPLNTFIVLSGGSPYYAETTNYVFIPYAYLQYPAFERGFNDLFLFAEMGNSVGHEMMHGFDTSGIKMDADGNPSKDIDIANSTKYSNGLKCLRQTKTFSLDEKLADFSGFRLAYDTYFQQPKVPKYTAGETVLTSKQLFFIKFAQFFCTVDPIRINYDESHDTPFRRVPEVVANNPEFEEVFSCPLKTDEAFVEKCKLW